jgi:cobalamin biosynthesis protein CobD/CbiB
MATGIIEIQIALETVTQSCSVKNKGNLPTANRAVRDVARRDLR